MPSLVHIVLSALIACTITPIIKLIPGADPGVTTATTKWRARRVKAARKVLFGPRGLPAPPSPAPSVLGPVLLKALVEPSLHLPTSTSASPIPNTVSVASTTAPTAATTTTTVTTTVIITAVVIPFTPAATATPPPPKPKDLAAARPPQPQPILASLSQMLARYGSKIFAGILVVLFIWVRRQSIQSAIVYLLSFPRRQAPPPPQPARLPQVVFLAPQIQQGPLPEPHVILAPLPPPAAPAEVIEDLEEHEIPGHLLLALRVPPALFALHLDDDVDDIVIPLLALPAELEALGDREEEEELEEVALPDLDEAGEEVEEIGEVVALEEPAPFAVPLVEEEAVAAEDEAPAFAHDVNHEGEEEMREAVLPDLDEEGREEVEEGGEVVALEEQAPLAVPLVEDEAVVAEDEAPAPDQALEVLPVIDDEVEDDVVDHGGMDGVQEGEEVGVAPAGPGAEEAEQVLAPAPEEEADEAAAAEHEPIPTVPVVDERVAVEEVEPLQDDRVQRDVLVPSPPAHQTAVDLKVEHAPATGPATASPGTPLLRTGTAEEEEPARPATPAVPAPSPPAPRTNEDVEAQHAPADGSAAASPTTLPGTAEGEPARPATLAAPNTPRPIRFNPWAGEEAPSPPAHSTPCPQRVAVEFMQPHPPAAPSFSATSSLPLIPDGAALAPMVNLPIPAPATPILFNRWANADPPSPPAHGTPCPQRVAVPFDTPRASQPSGSSLLPSPLFATSFLTLVVEDDALTAVVSLPSRASVRRRSSSAAQQAKESAAGSSRGAAGVLDGTMEVRGVDDERTCDADGAEGTLVARTPRRLERRREPSHLATPQQLQLELYGHGELGEVSFLANEWQQLVDPVLRTPYASGSEVDNDDEEAAIA